MEGDKFIRPNGLSCRPLGLNFIEILENYEDKIIIELPKGLVLPDDFVMILERSDHHSLQTTRAIDPAEYEKLA
jgi:hypothetical protein